MKVLHVTFRYGKDIYGGAEFHMRKLSEELYKKGVNVDICTTKSSGLASLIKSGVLWDNKLENENINGIEVYRFPVKNPNKYSAILIEKILQRRLDYEEELEENSILSYMSKSFDEKGAILLTGWNHLERYGASAMRWTRRNSSFLINDLQIHRILITLSNPKKVSGKIEIKSNGFKKDISIMGELDSETIEIDVPNISGKLLVSIKLDKAWTKLADHRTLGVYISDISYESDDSVKKVDMEYDYRKYFIKKGIYIEHIYKRANSRPMFYSRLFDYMRGPNSPDMVKWLKKHAKEYDLIMAQMFPFNTIKYSLLYKGDKPLVLMPLMHIDDEFYHWPHYYSYLKKADYILAISSYSKINMFDKIGAKSSVVGAGIDTGLYLNKHVNGDDFRKKFGLEDKKIILTVSRKSPSKRYDLLIKAMENVKKTNKDAILVMVGPDEDKIPICSDTVLYLGKLADKDLVNAYDACDVFAMMSESESFGMVFCEAWSRLKPVIGNACCGPVASLIEDGVDGYLCNNSIDLADKIMLLLQDDQLRRRLGKKGYIKVMENYTWEKVADKVYDCYRRLLSENNYDEY